MMRLDLSRVDIPLLAAGVVVWLGVLLVVWWLYREPSSLQRESDFQAWKNRHNRPHASFPEFIGSEQTPRSYLSKSDLTFVITAIALLVLFEVLRTWGVLN